MPTTRCSCCGSGHAEQTPILWPELIEEWELSPEEAAYIDRQQGYQCTQCGASLRSMALAQAIVDQFDYHGTLNEFVRNQGEQLRVLEINEAGQLTQFLRVLSGHTLVTFPDVDMQDLPFKDRSYDLVVHSDTLEHVPNPVAGLTECRRVMAAGGATCFTVPIVIGRLTRDRSGLKPSFHGSREDPVYLVKTEYGADAWLQVLQAGFDEFRVTCFEYPAGLAIAAMSRHDRPQDRASILSVEEKGGGPARTYFDHPLRDKSRSKLA